jgi:hypothetical protein
VKKKHDLKLYAAVGLDPIKQELMVLGIGQTYEEAKRGLTHATDDHTYRFVFSVLGKNAGLDLRDWLRGVGLTGDDARDTAREFYRQLGEMLKDKKP